jgi:GntR family uxuAB operon transcriptional repressor
MTKNHKSRCGAPEIASILRQKINSGLLKTSERLPAERLLADTYSVARGTVRKALNILAIEKIVDIRPGSGTFVKFTQSEATHTIIENASPLELIDARFALEPHICRLAVLHATQQDLDKADQLLVQMDASVNDPNRFSEADNAFHTLLVKTTGNRLLIWIMSQINTVRNQEQWSRMRRLTLNENSIAEYNNQHRQVLNELKAREPERAAMLMQSHLETARLSLTRITST